MVFQRTFGTKISSQDGWSESRVSARSWKFRSCKSSYWTKPVFVRLGAIRVARDGGGSFHRGDRDERSTGHPRVLPRALQVLQCRSLSARVRLSFSISHRILKYKKYLSVNSQSRLVGQDLIVYQKNSMLFLCRYYQIRTALRVSPKLPVKVEVNQPRNRKHFK